MRFGINTWAWALPVDDSNLDAFLDWAVALDLPGDRPLIEVFASPNPDDLPAARALRDKAAARGFGVVACGFNPYENAPGDPNPHLVSPDADEREAAESGHLFHVHVCENHRGEFGAAQRSIRFLAACR
jgi:sugar phosphate isomerase/epimerase